MHSHLQSAYCGSVLLICGANYLGKMPSKGTMAGSITTLPISNIGENVTVRDLTGTLVMVLPDLECHVKDDI